MKKKKWYSVLLGLTAGVLNGLFGAGGGIVAVPMLEKAKLSPQKAHATSIAVILPLTAVSAILYLYKGNLKLGEALIYLPFGLVGAVVGAVLLKKIPNHLLRRIFGGVIVASAVRMLLK